MIIKKIEFSLASKNRPVTQEESQLNNWSIDLDTIRFVNKTRLIILDIYLPIRNLEGLFHRVFDVHFDIVIQATAPAYYNLSATSQNNSIESK